MTAYFYRIKRGGDLETAVTSRNEKVSTIPDLSAYTDFRLYLHDYFEFKKNTESTVLRPYTYSVFSASADIKSPNYLKLVIEGQRNLSEQMVLKFAKAMKFNKLQTEEFGLLVEYGQETDPQKRAQALRRLADYRFKHQVKNGVVTSKTHELLPNWLTWLLYHLTDQAGVDFKPEKIRELIRTQTNIEEIRRSIHRLLEAGLLTRNVDDGTIHKGKDLIDDHKDVPPAVIKKLQTELMYLGMESLFLDSPTDREFGALTVSLTEEEFNRFKFELRQLRKKWQKDIAVNRAGAKGQRVYQLNVQLFPITEKSQ